LIVEDLGQVSCSQITSPPKRLNGKRVSRRHFEEEP